MPRRGTLTIQTLPADELRRANTIRHSDRRRHLLAVLAEGVDVELDRLGDLSPRFVHCVTTRDASRKVRYVVE